MTRIETPRNMAPREEQAEEGYMTCFPIFMKGVDIFSLFKISLYCVCFNIASVSCFGFLAAKHVGS